MVVGDFVLGDSLSINYFLAICGNNPLNGHTFFLCFGEEFGAKGGFVDPGITCSLVMVFIPRLLIILVVLE